LRRFTLYILIALLLFVCLSGSLFASGNSDHSKKDDPIVIRLWGGGWGIPPPDAVDPWERSRRAVFERFLELHPNIKLENASGLDIQGPAGESGLLMAMAGGTAPDVFYVNFRKLHLYIGQNFLYPLNEYIDKDPEVFQRVHPTIQKVITVDGKVYSIPWYQCVMAMYYRKDMYRAAGLDPNKPPLNWDQFYEYSKKLTVPEKGQYGFAFQNTPSGTAFHWINFLWQAGGEVVGQDKNGQWKSMFNTPEGVVAVKFFKKLMIGEWVRPSDGRHFKGVVLSTPDIPKDVAQDKIAQWFNYSTDMVTNRSDINPDLIGIAALPAGPKGRANEINAGMWGMSSQIKDKRTRDAVWEFMKFMNSDEAERVRTKSYVESGLGKLVNPDILEKYGYTEYLKDIPPAWVEANKVAFKHGHPEPHGKNCEMIYVQLNYPLQEVILHPKADIRKVLDAAAFRVDTKMLGYIDPVEMQHKRKIAWKVFAAILILIASITVVQLRKLAGSASEEAEDTRVVRGNKMIHVIAWFFMAPAVLSIVTWAYYPLIRGMLMAFQNYHIIGGTSWVGLDNFIEALGQETFWIGIVNSLTYVAINLSLGFFVPIGLAIMLNEIPRGKMLFRTLFYLPAVTSGLVIMFLWRWFYDPSPQGLFNTMISYYNNLAIGLTQHIPALAHLQIPQQLWLQDPKLAMLCVVLPGIWAGAGPGSIIYLAAMKGIPDEMYEAADLDGAGGWSKIRHVTFQQLKPLIVINFIGAFIGSFKAMETIFIMTGGGPLNATHTIGLEIWYNAFMYLKFGYATAAAWMMGSMLIGFTIYQLRMLRNVRFSATGRED